MMAQMKCTRWSSPAACSKSMSPDPVILSKTDRPTSVRQGEELPIDRLSEYLNEHLDSIEEFPSGFSNLTYLIRAGDRELVLRRPPIGSKIKTAHDITTENRHLYPVYQKVPRPLLFWDDESVLGVPFYVMERVNGIILRAQKPHGFDLSPS